MMLNGKIDRSCFFLMVNKIVLVSIILNFSLLNSIQASLNSAGHYNLIPINATPYDYKISRTGLLNFIPIKFSGKERESAESLFLKARAFRYVKEHKRDIWQTPQETQARGSGDCEDKAVWLFYQLRQNGYQNVSLVIGKYKSVSRGFHVWVAYTDENSDTYLLDPANQKRIWHAGNFTGAYYEALYSFDGQRRYRHISEA